VKLTPVGGTANDGLFRAANGTLYFRKYREGKGEICRSTKTKDLVLARRKRDELMAELWGDRRKVVRRNTVGELWPTWFRGKAATKSAGTASSIHSSWKNLEPYIKDKFPDEVSEDWWVTVYIPRKREEVNSRTKCANPKRKFMNERKWLLAFLKYLKRQDLVQKVPNLINPDPARARAEIFSRTEFVRLCRTADWSLRAKLVMGRDHFMRRSEIAFLAWDRVDRENRTIHLRAEDTKIRKARTFPYNRRLERLFRLLLADQARAGVPSPFVFPSPTDANKSILRDGFATAWRNCKGRAKVDVRKKFHWLRHTGLTTAFRRQRLGAALICQFAGLSLEEAQRTYLHLTTDDLRGVEDLVGHSVKIREVDK
jgi:integrase